jgi:hypothetical protein
MDKIREYCEDIKTLCAHLSDDAESQPVCQGTIDELKDFLDETYKRPEGMYSRVRRMIGQVVTNISTLMYLRQKVRMTPTQMEKGRRLAQETLETRNRNQTVLTIEYIREVIQRLRAGVTFADKVLLLMLACGARKIEVLNEKTSKFQPDGLHYIRQIGIAKQKGGQDFTVRRPLCFIKTDEFINLLTDVRETVQKRHKESAKDIGKTFSHQLEKLSQFYWPQNVALNNRTGTHINRAIYVNMARKLYGERNESLTHFIKRCLGHESMGVAASYMNVDISFAADDDKREEALRQQENIDVDSVALNSKYWTTVTFRVVPKRKLTKQERCAVALDCGKQLFAAGVPVTRVNLMALGVQSRIVTMSGVLNDFRE